MGRSRQSAQTSGSAGERKNGSAEWQEEQILTWALDTTSREGSGAASCSEGIGGKEEREAGSRRYYTTRATDGRQHSASSDSESELFLCRIVRNKFITLADNRFYSSNALS